MCTPNELVPDVLPGYDDFGVDLGVVWRCSGGVLESSGGVLGEFWDPNKHPEKPDGSKIS